MTTPVSFELAKLLKEKGLDLPCFHYYENEKLIEPYLENGSSSDTEFRVDLSDLKEHFNKWSKRISAPTIAEVVMWLYEKHGIWVEVVKPVRQKLFRFNVDNKDDMNEFVSAVCFNSPTQAYEAAIKYTLEHTLKQKLDKQ